MTREQLVELVQATKGKFFSVAFIKRNGERRVMNGKNFYADLLRGGNSTLEHSMSVPVVDRNKGEFRAVNADTLISFKCGKISA